ncbi:MULTISPECIES: PilN domain-containing protein [Moraxella]|jgi:fimbrial assembly|uniref:Fimbrial assembly protein (PilN) n=1 Tax=Moraxella lacunata TaxID=477 RepID=A0A1B8Q620_MORLA|nr:MULTISPECIES: PilN domain-containing protein [Moraxella]MBE9578648.1 PilN domain-containing protein [Moraxella sp. K1664]MBE9586981.1 PilN domain-containing protein [Moraxella sp. K1630]MBE9595219.1 PilN domain-containing protein [Moraxella sp. K2450]MDH9218968.1 PilN domain-containing protein [Moraxella lacunata]MDI4482240.1 pilus assembly protein PilS [Moraxella lacunata]
MARINLLPWRKEQRERRNKEFNLLAAATAGLAILATILVLSILNRDLTNQQNANKRIEDANAQLDVALKSIEDLEAQREQMLAQMKVIQDLQGRRSVPVRVWDNIARAIPRDTMYLNNIKREGDVIRLTGFAANPNVVANLVRNLNASEWLDGSAVVSIKSGIQAYQGTPSQQVANAGARSVYPEDSYVEFVATTKIQYQEAKDEATDSAGEDVALPPVTVDSQGMDNQEMPEVSVIGVDNAPAQTPSTTSETTPPSAPTNNTTVDTEATDAPNTQNAQPTPTDGSTQVGGQS